MKPIMGAAAALLVLSASTASAEEGPRPTGSLVAGTALVGIGAAAAAGGAFAYTWLGMQTPGCLEGCADPYRTEKGASVVSIVLGTASIAVGIPLMVVGDDEEEGPQKPRTAPLAPELRVGPTGGSLAFSF